MRRGGTRPTGWRSLGFAVLLAPVLGAVLLIGSIDLHSRVHERQGAAALALLGDHPERTHLDSARSSHDVRCVACLAGLRSQDRPAAAPRVAGAPETRGRLAAEASPFGAVRFPYRLPLSRAPPLS